MSDDIFGDVSFGSNDGDMGNAVIRVRVRPGVTVDGEIYKYTNAAAYITAATQQPHAVVPGCSGYMVIPLAEAREHNLIEKALTIAEISSLDELEQAKQEGQSGPWQPGISGPEATPSEEEGPTPEPQGPTRPGWLH